VEGHTHGAETTLRHLGESAELCVRDGRLVRGAGYGGASADARRALARTGAIMRLRERGRYYVHAAGVVDPMGRAWLLVGDTGAGKSTLAYGLARVGWGVLGDDGVVLGEEPDGMRAFAWRGPLMVSASLARFFPELERRRGDVVPGDVRQRVPCSAAVPPSAPLRGLIFVERGVGGELEPLSRSLALANLIGQSPWVLLADDAARLHFRALERATNEVPAYRLRHGPADLPRLADIFGAAAQE